MRQVRARDRRRRRRQRAVVRHDVDATPAQSAPAGMTANAITRSSSSASTPRGVSF